MGDIRKDWKFKTGRYVWPAMMLISFLAALVTMPKGLSFVPWDEAWYLFDGCAVAMLAFWILWVRGGRWDE